MSYYRDESYQQTDSYQEDDYRRGGGRGGGYDDDRYTQTTTTTYQDDDRYGGGRRGGYNDDRFTETTTTTTSYDDDRYGGGRPPPPQGMPRPWFAEWDERERRYVFINNDTGERRWEFPRDGGYYESDSRTTTYTQQDDSERRGGGHGMMYGAMGAVAGLAAGGLAMYEGERIHNDFERDKYRVEDDVSNFPDDAANWAGRKVGEVEAIPQDIDNGFDRLGNRIEQGFDDVVDAPEDVANWAGRKVGDVERYGDNIDNAYDEGKYEGRNDDDGGW